MEDRNDRNQINPNRENNQMEVPNNPWSWGKRGLEINHELLQLSPERVEEIRRIISFMQRHEKLKDDETKGYLTPKDLEDLKQSNIAEEKYTDLLEQIKTLKSSQ
jgi:hypothetical protein